MRRHIHIYSSDFFCAETNKMHKNVGISESEPFNLLILNSCVKTKTNTKNILFRLYISYIFTHFIAQFKYYLKLMHRRRR